MASTPEQRPERFTAEQKIRRTIHRTTLWQRLFLSASIMLGVTMGAAGEKTDVANAALIAEMGVLGAAYTERRYAANTCNNAVSAYKRQTMSGGDKDTKVIVTVENGDLVERGNFDVKAWLRQLSPDGDPVISLAGNALTFFGASGVTANTIANTATELAYDQNTVIVFSGALLLAGVGMTVGLDAAIEEGRVDAYVQQLDNIDGPSGISFTE